MKTWDEMTDREQLESIHYEMVKDAYGFRNRSFPYATTSDEELRADMARMQQMIADQEEAQDREYEAAAERFEAKLRDLQTCVAGCDTRTAALRWLLESLDNPYVLGDADHACYEFGLPYGYFKNEEMFA